MYIFTKFIIAAILTSVPFLFATVVKPKAKKNGKWHNLLTAIASTLPVARKLANRLTNAILGFRNGMSKNKSMRKIFTLLIIILLLTTQFIDMKAAEAILRVYNQAAMNKQTFLVTTDINYDFCGISSKLLANTNKNWIYPFMTPPTVHLFTLIFTVMLYSSKMSDKIFSRLHNDLHAFVLIGFISVVLLFIDEGRYLLLSETLFIVTQASAFYPAKITSTGSKT